MVTMDPALEQRRSRTAEAVAAPRRAAISLQRLSVLRGLLVPLLILALWQITVNREVEGFVLNRLQGALLAEAFRLVGEGVVSPQDLDKTVKDGLGLRWSFLGPFETIELNAPGGIADYCNRYTGFYRRLSQDPARPHVWDEENVNRILDGWGEAPGPDELARRSARRDKRLAALRAHKQSQSDT